MKEKCREIKSNDNPLKIGKLIEFISDKIPRNAIYLPILKTEEMRTIDTKLKSTSTYFLVDIRRNRLLTNMYHQFLVDSHIRDLLKYLNDNSILYSDYSIKFEKITETINLLDEMPELPSDMRALLEEQIAAKTNDIIFKLVSTVTLQNQELYKKELTQFNSQLNNI